jgi:hypothetical protein
MAIEITYRNFTTKISVTPLMVLAIVRVIGLL